MKISEYRIFITQLSQARDAMDSLVVFKALIEKADTTLRAREKEIIRKEGVIVRTLEQRNNCYAERDNLTAQMKAKDEIIATQERVIQKHGKPKYWGLGLVAGYGYSLSSTAVRAPFIGIALYRQLIKF